MTHLLIYRKINRLGMMTNSVSSSSKGHHRKIVGNNHIFIRFGHKQKADHAIRMGNRALESMQKRNDLVSTTPATTAATTTQASTTSRAQTNAIISEAIPYDLRASTTFETRFRKFGPLSPTAEKKTPLEEKTELQEALIEKQSCFLKKTKPPLEDFQNPRNVPEATGSSNATATIDSQVRVTNEYIRQKHLPSVEASIVPFAQKSQEYPTHEFSNHVVFLRGTVTNAVENIMFKPHVICMQVLQIKGGSLFGMGLVLSSVDRTPVDIPEGCFVIRNNQEKFLDNAEYKRREYSLKIGDQRILDFVKGKEIQNGSVPEFIEVSDYSLISKVMLNGAVVITSTALILESSKGNNVDHKTDAKTVVIDYQDLLIKEREDFFMKSPQSIPSAPISGLSSAKKGVWGKRGGGNNGSGSNGNESGGGTNES